MPSSKVDKYISRINALLHNRICTSKEVEKQVGILVWASYFKTQGRPFISALSSKIMRLFSKTKIKFGDCKCMALLI